MASYLLVQAKAFLCWECLPGLAVQLVEVQGPVSYFFAPQAERPAIVVFVPRHSDGREALYLLFHEAGHYLHYLELVAQGHAGDYWRMVDCPSGEERQAFEREAWHRGRRLLAEFVQKYLPDHQELLVGYDECGRQKVASYAPFHAEGSAPEGRGQCVSAWARVTAAPFPAFRWSQVERRVT